MEEAEAPEGVTLIDPEDSDSMRGLLENDFKGAIARYTNDQSYGGVRLKVRNLRYADQEKYSIKEQHEAKLDDKFLHRRLRGDVELIDEETNEVLDKRKGLTLAKVPYLTERGTFINNGSEFSPVMQSRLLPGVYTRRRDNGELETHMNVRPGTGSPMRVTLDPQTAQYRLKIGSSNLHAYSAFRELGVSDEELEKRWGPEILAANKAKFRPKTIDRMYNKAIRKWDRVEGATTQDKITAIRSSFDKAQVATNIMKSNLPNLFDREKSASWRMNGRAVELAEGMTKRATTDFNPNMSVNEILHDWLSFDFELEKSAAEFSPDLEPEQMNESYRDILGKAGPNLASIRDWPDHWMDDGKGNQGWLQWYDSYTNGKRTGEDDKQKERWNSFRRKHVALFLKKPTARRAFALRNWGIDPVHQLPEEDQDAFRDVMGDYRNKEYMKWYLNRHDMCDDSKDKMLALASNRGMDIVSGASKDKLLMQAALENYIKPEDLI